MPDFRETRSTVARWRSILIPTYAELVNLGAGDVWVFGSQALSLYMPRPLASKDIDFIAAGITIPIVEGLCNRLAKFSSQRRPDYIFQNFVHEGLSNPEFVIYLREANERPFAVELFLTYNGHDLRELTRYTTLKTRWGHEFQTLSIEALIATRLAFRPEDRISPFNAQRLNLFIEAVRPQINWGVVEEFARRFHSEATIRENLKLLKRKGIKITDSGRLSFLSDERVTSK